MKLRFIWPVYLAAPAVLTGVHAVLPALPSIQRELGLDDSQIGLVTSLYLLPSVLAAIPAGMLADRFGRRNVLTLALVVFGLGGLYLTLNPASFVQILLVRAVQGAAAGTVLPLTVTIIGDAVSGPKQVTAQGYRSVAMGTGDGLFPLVGGLLVGLAWWAPFTTQILALPIAAMTWVGLAGLQRPGSRIRARLGQELRSWASHGPIFVLQGSGFLRFFFKLAVLTYLPVLAVSEGIASPATVGVLLAISAVAATIGAPTAGWLARRRPPSLLIALSLATIAASLGAMTAFATLPALVIAMVTFGFADGVYGTLVTAALTQAVPAEQRATFVGLSATIRNLGKFAAPTVIGVLVLYMPLRAAFAIIAVAATLMIVSAWPLRRFDEVIQKARPLLELPADT